MVYKGSQKPDERKTEFKVIEAGVLNACKMAARVRDPLRRDVKVRSTVQVRFEKYRHKFRSLKDCAKSGRRRDGVSRRGPER